MLPRSQRLTSAQFERAFSQSQTVRHPLVALRVHRRSVDETSTRAAFVVPKKQGKATQRNRTKRRLRERYRLAKFHFAALANCDLIFLTTPAAHRASNAELDAALEDVLRRAAKKMSFDSKPHQTPEFAKESFVDESQTAPFVDEERAASFVDETVVDEEQSARFPTFSGAPLTWLALQSLRFYQRFVSPGLPPSCRFYPTCSRYTHDAIVRFGLGRGLVLGASRVCRCHPFHAGGVDLVPEQFPVWNRSSLFNSLARRRFSPPKK